MGFSCKKVFFLSLKQLLAQLLQSEQVSLTLVELLQVCVLLAGLSEQKSPWVESWMNSFG